MMINGEKYQDMLKDFLLHVIKDKPKILFQQDGATCRTSKSTMEFLNGILGKNIISRKSETSWPPWSLGLKALDFFCRVI